jgi:hypothetical protein
MTRRNTQRYLHPDRQSLTNAGELLSRHLWSQIVPNFESFSRVSIASSQVEAIFVSRVDSGRCHRLRVVGCGAIGDSRHSARG